MIRVLLVDDHQLVREGIQNILSEASDIQVVGEASDGQEAQIKARELKPDLVLMDLQMPVFDGISAIGPIKEDLPETKVAALTVVDTDRSLFQALKAGADGYLLKNMSSLEFIKAVRSIMQGEVTVSSPLAARILRAFADGIQGKDIKPQDPLSSISEREREVLELLSTGLTYSQVAQTLFISENTVKNHVHNAVRKLHVKNRIEAIVLVSETMRK